MGLIEYNRINLSKELKDQLPKEIVDLLHLFGVPVKVASNTYQALSEPIIKDGRLIIGRTPETNIFNYLFIDLDDFAIKHQWNYPGSTRVAFINSGLKQLYFTISFLEEIVNQLIEIESFGDYHNNHAKYAELFKRILLKNDPQAYESAGMWYWYIEEMELGVI